MSFGGSDNGRNATAMFNRNATAHNDNIVRVLNPSILFLNTVWYMFYEFLEKNNKNKICLTYLYLKGKKYLYRAEGVFYVMAVYI